VSILSAFFWTPSIELDWHQGLAEHTATRIEETVQAKVKTWRLNNGGAGNQVNDRSHAEG
jgi:hypothetical protein